MRSTPDVYGYLGRILNDQGDGVGTCFQVRPGVLVTAWHVLNDVNAGTIGSQVLMAALTEGDPTTAVVQAIDEQCDLAVLICAAPLAASVSGLVASSTVAPAAPVVVVGVSLVPYDERLKTTSTTGVWQGPAVRADRVTLGQMDAAGMVKGMSGAPVRRISDDRVVGVVSARYNSATSRMRDTVWVARTEDLDPLLGGHSMIDPADLSSSEPDRAHLIKLISIHERNVRHLESQAAGFGSLHVPMHTANQLEDERAELARLRHQLEQSS